jgi:hypothetical protein
MYIPATTESPQAREVIDHELILSRQNDFVAACVNMSRKLTGKHEKPKEGSSGDEI